VSQHRGRAVHPSVVFTTAVAVAIDTIVQWIGAAAWRVIARRE
jgi:hypothetical protein